MVIRLPSNAFFVASNGVAKRRMGENEPKGFITAGGEFRDGPPSAPIAPPPSRYTALAKQDEAITENMGGGNNLFKTPPPPPAPPPPTEPTGAGRDNYKCDVFDMVARTTNLWRDNQVLPNLAAHAYNSGQGTITIHDVGYAAELNRQHQQEHLRENLNRSWVEPHAEQRLVIDYVPNTFPATYERAYSSSAGNIAGDPSHAQVFVTTVGSLSSENLRDAVAQYQLTQRPQNIANVTLDQPSQVTRSLVARSTTGKIQYMVYRDDAKFEPK